MAQGPAIQTGIFTADGSNKTIMLKADADRVIIENETEMAATNSGHGFRYTWYLGLRTSMIMEYHPSADHTSAIDVISDAILPIDRFTIREDLDFISITAGTNATQPVYSTADTDGLESGSIIRIYETDQSNLNGIDFLIDNVVTNTSFRIASTLATAPGIVAGASGSYINVSYDPYTDEALGSNFLNYKGISRREINIVDITKASAAVITTATNHYVDIDGYIKITVPSVYGMTQLDAGVARAVSVTDTTITTDIDSSAFTAFKFPIYTDYPFDKATIELVKDRDDTDENVDNQGNERVTNERNALLAMTLKAGSALPAGSSGDVIRWTVYNAEDEDDEFYDEP